MKTESSLFKSFLFALAGLFIVSCTAESLKESLGVKPKPATDMVSIEDAQDELQKILDDIEVQSTRAGFSDDTENSAKSITRAVFNKDLNVVIGIRR